VSDSLPLEFEFISSMAPVQAEGTVAGRAFYFRSRYTTWRFTIAEQPDGDPVALALEDVPPSGAAWCRGGEVPGGRFAASYLPLDEARSIILECARDYIRERATGHDQSDHLRPG